jgi:hypothetical protein
MRSLKVFLVGMSAVAALAMACGGSTSNSGGGGNESDSGSSSGGSSGSSSGGMDATSSSSSGSSSGGSSGSSGSSSGATGDGGNLQCTTPTSCGTGSVCCATVTNTTVTTKCETGTMCPMGSGEVCDPAHPMCPAGEECRTRNGGSLGVCRTPRDGGTATDAASDAAAD